MIEFGEREKVVKPWTSYLGSKHAQYLAAFVVYNDPVDLVI